MSCLICQSINCSVIRGTLRNDIKRDVLQCNDCSFVFLRVLPEGTKAYYEQETYRKKHGPDLTKESTCQDVFDTYFPFQGTIIKSMGDLLKPETKVLDVGCSTGHFLAALEGKVGTRVGVELSQDEVQYCQKTHNFPVYGESIETVNIPEGPFDIVTSFQVVEHVDNPVEFLMNLGKHMKDDGTLYIELPNLDDVLLSLYDIPEYADFYYREPHLSYFSKKTLEDLVDKAGFEGVVGNVQRYNIFNHLQWQMNGSPQNNFTIGNRETFLEENNNPATAKFNQFFKRMDEEYKALVEKNFLGESLTFTGKKK
ncbi:hypothetical protein COU75_03860 [Candidatus Peregrinibacteria bacterium CG10_big_fil_rev_8_21_14_0_10_42_8]|nr:MAG: hypothetical protein COU75_03860 [Candidatus Peregrinibacteria bacterium CG10_big_fil_rev_8_21_14_0_10_42_8]